MVVEVETKSAEPSQAEAHVAVEVDDFPTQRSGPRRVYGSTNAADARLADLPAGGGDPLGRLIGRTLAGRYKIDAVIGRRLRGTAYRATDRDAGGGGDRWRYVTVTVLDDRLAGDRAALERLRRSAETVRRLQHPALDAPTEILDEDGLVFLVSPYRPGRALADLLGRTAGAGWPLRSVLPLGYRIAEALAPAHAAGLAHGALDAASVLVTADEGVVVLNLGLGPSLDGADVDPAEDVLGLARLVLALLAGDGGPHRGAVPKRPAGLRETAWAGLLAGLASDRSLRPDSPEALMVSLEDPGWLRRLVGRRLR